MRASWDRISGAARRRDEWTRRAFEELESLDRAAGGPRNWHAASAPRRAPRRRLGLAAVGAGAVLIWAPLSGLGDDAPRPGGVWMPELVRGEADRPSDARRERLLSPPQVSPGGAHAFMQEGRPPVSYDPCVPIHVEINVRTGGPNAVPLVEGALDDVQAATGLEFVVDGLTERAPRLDAAVRRSDLGRPVLIAWSDPAEVPELEGRTAGLGGSVAVRTDRDEAERYVTGQVVLDGPALAQHSSADQSAIIRHELGHLVGLGHVDDPRELMYVENTGSTEWGPGDRYGLALLGSGTCE